MKRFLLLSLLLHTLLLTAWLQRQPVPPQQPALHALQLEFTSPPTAGRKQPEPSPAAHTDNSATRPAQRQALRSRAALTDRTDAAKADAAAGALSSPARADSAQTAAVDSDALAPAQQDRLNQVRAVLHSALQASFRYPRRARQRGWQGTVVITLRILPDGGVTDVQVASSSGIRVLDNAARDTVSALRLPQVTDWMNGRTLAMQIPVEYRLTDG